MEGGDARKDFRDGLGCTGWKDQQDGKMSSGAFEI
jgi:hypothetical protein